METSKNLVIIPDSVFRHIDICNNANFESKKVFYNLKKNILQNFARFDGYDLQHYWKYRHYWAQFFHYDMITDYRESTNPEEWEKVIYREWSKESSGIECKSNQDYDDYDETDMRLVWSDDALLRCVSEHKQILERYTFLTDTLEEKSLHIPTDEFWFRAYKTNKRGETIRHSDNFFKLQPQCQGVLGIKDRELKHGTGTDSFKFLINYFKNTKYCSN